MFCVIIPARYGSVRLPGKALLDLCGKPLIQHVYEQARLSTASKVIIATDSERIKEVAQGFNAHVCLTSETHQSGTDRIAEVIDQLNFDDNDIVVNLQGDEPLMPPLLINQVAQDLQSDEQAEVATLCFPIENSEDVFNSDIVKVIVDKNDHAVYFSRAPIPWHRDQYTQRSTAVSPVTTACLRHIGLYAYRCGLLRKFVTWPMAQIEQVEYLEQLRMIWNATKIHVSVANTKPGQDVNTKMDLQQVQEIIMQRV